jgi:hypothetical protein
VAHAGAAALNASDLDTLKLVWTWFYDEGNQFENDLELQSTGQHKDEM